MTHKLSTTRWVGALMGLLLACEPEAGDPTTPAPATPTATSTPTPTPTPVPTPTPTPTATAEPTAAPAVMGVQGTVPSDGAMAIPRLPGIQVALTRDLPAGQEGAVSASLFGDEGEIPLQIDAAEDEPGDSQVAFLPTVPLAKDGEYRLEVEVSEVAGLSPLGGEWPLTFTSTFSTRVPCGVAFDIARGIQIHALGGNVALVALLQNVLDQTSLDPVALMFVDQLVTTTFPASAVRLVAGLPRRGDEGGYVPDPAYGFPVSVDDCDLDPEGRMVCAETTFVFPIPITDTTVLYLSISQARLAGTANSSGSFMDLDDFSLDGVITEQDLLLALQAAGLASLVDYVKLDVDLDGDGVFDAASASASSNPVWLDFEGCDEAAP